MSSILWKLAFAMSKFQLVLTIKAAFKNPRNFNAARNPSSASLKCIVKFQWKVCGFPASFSKTKTLKTSDSWGAAEASCQLLLGEILLKSGLNHFFGIQLERKLCLQYKLLRHTLLSAVWHNTAGYHFLPTSKPKGPWELLSQHQHGFLFPVHCYFNFWILCLLFYRCLWRWASTEVTLIPPPIKVVVQCPNIHTLFTQSTLMTWWRPFTWMQMSYLMWILPSVSHPTPLQVWPPQL